MMKHKSKAVKVPQEGIHEAANRKRDNIISKVRDGKNENPGKEQTTLSVQAERQLAAYLTEKKKKHTPERFFVLRQVYACQGPIDIHTLYNMVCEEQGMVSLSTVYNNLALLVDAKLVRKLDLVDGKMAFFERTLGQEPHGYMICDQCGSIRVIGLPDMSTYKIPRGYHLHDVTFHIHGLCTKCAKKALATEKQR